MLDTVSLNILGNGSCEDADWQSSFDNQGWSNCSETSPFINGLFRSSTPNPSEDKIYLLEKASCCRKGSFYAECVVADWTSSFER